MVEETGNAAQETTNESDDAFEFEVLEAVTRLLIGGTLEGSSELIKRLQVWEEDTAVSRQPTASTATEESTATQVRYALIGALFNAESHLKKKQLPFLKKATQLSMNRVAAILTPATNNRVAHAFDKQLNDWSQRGEEILNGWIENGRTEEAHSRTLARHGTTVSIDEILNLLAENKELQNLITEQGTGLATEALDQARERTVTADDIAERFVRTILRRPPRQTLLPQNSSHEAIDE